VAAGLHHSMAITATEHVYTWGGLQSKRDPLKAVHRPSVVPLLSGRQPHISSGNGCASHALVTTFDVLGPLLIVFDEPAARVKEGIYDVENMEILILLSFVAVVCSCALLDRLYLCLLDLSLEFFVRYYYYSFIHSFAFSYLLFHLEKKTGADRAQESVRCRFERG